MDEWKILFKFMIWGYPHDLGNLHETPRKNHWFAAGSTWDWPKHWPACTQCAANVAASGSGAPDVHRCPTAHFMRKMRLITVHDFGGIPFSYCCLVGNGWEWMGMGEWDDYD